MTEDSGTTDQDYRWRWLATVWALAYGVGFPCWMAATAWGARPYPPGTLMGVLVTAWLATVVYIIGPENLKVVQEMRGK